VRQDYVSRLDGVADDLVKHQSDLVSSLEDRQGTVESLQADRDSQAADLEEVRLRRTVGEFSEEKWNSNRQTIEASLDKFDSLLAVEGDAVSELTAVIHSIGEIASPRPQISLVIEKAVDGEAHAKAADPDADSEADEGVAAQDPSWSEVLSEITGDDEATGASDDELAFLESVSPDDFKKMDPIVAMLNDE